MRFALLCVVLGCELAAAQPSTFVPAGGNSWTSPGSNSITPDGIVYGPEASVSRFYVRLSPGDLQVSLAGETSQPASVRVAIQATSREVNLVPGLQQHPSGTWTIATEGYAEVIITGRISGTLRGLILSGSAVQETNAFVRDNEGSFYYWGRRGPSVHLRFDLQGKNDIEWFYSEITVPEGNDVIGSYFMANGFASGYFGFQVNSETERRVLFSVWSPFKTDDPKSIPEEDRIILVKKGDGVYTGEFGNEGSGGQSYLRYHWKAGTTYGFLLRGQPENERTVYTAWFFPPEEGKWKLIASWRRPKSGSYLTSLYSFLENFIPETGNLERRALYGNQWVRDAAGNWIELTQAKFTGDNTARKNYRKDYGGGTTGETFYLRNCGFFSDFTQLDQTFRRKPKDTHPKINLKTLP